MNLHEIIQLEAKRLEKEVHELEVRLEKTPKGSLQCHKSGKIEKLQVVFHRRERS